MTQQKIILQQALVNHRKKTCKMVIWIMGESVPICHKTGALCSKMSRLRINNINCSSSFFIIEIVIKEVFFSLKTSFSLKVKLYYVIKTIIERWLSLTIFILHGIHFRNMTLYKRNSKFWAFTNQTLCWAPQINNLIIGLTWN